MEIKTLAVILVTAGVVMMGWSATADTMQATLNSYCCCGDDGSGRTTCSDTYYNGSACILTMCHSGIFWGENNCSYPADPKCDNMTLLSEIQKLPSVNVTK